MKKTLLLLLMLSFAITASAQQPVLNKKQLLQDIQVLAADSMQGRLSGTPGNQMAQEYIEKRFRQIGLKPFGDDYKHHFKLEGKGVVVDKATNLIGYVKGRSNKVIVVTAHYDHVGVKEGQIYNGTDDNASGVGGLLAAAAYFKKNKPKHTIIFAALDGEELGLKGANAFLENPPVALQNIVLNVNMDMLSINEEGQLYASGTYHNPYLKPLLEKVKPRQNAKLLIGHDQPEQGQDDWTSQSDHYQFHKRQIPFIYFGVEDHPHYHKPSDDFDKVNQAFYPDATGLVIDFIKVADKNKAGFRK